MLSGFYLSGGCSIHSEPLDIMTHGHSPKGAQSPEYRVWASMKTRCLNPMAAHYVRYGGRGISVCERWMKFENFLSDMGLRPFGMQLHRKDNDGPYCPSNCVWVDPFTHARLKRTNRWITAFGKTKCVTDWSIELGIPKESIFGRLNKGISGEAALRRIPPELRINPNLKRAKLSLNDINGIRSSYPGIGASKLAARYGVDRSMIYRIVKFQSWKYRA